MESGIALQGGDSDAAASLKILMLLLRVEIIPAEALGTLDNTAMLIGRFLRAMRDRQQSKMEDPMAKQVQRQRSRRQKGRQVGPRLQGGWRATDDGGAEAGPTMGG